MNLDFIAAIPTDVLEEMLEDISLEYPSREYFYESLNEVLTYQILSEATSSSIQQKRIQAIINKKANAGKRDRDRYQRKQTTQNINQGVKGKYDRRPWYKRAFHKLKSWIKGGIESLNNNDDNESDSTVVYKTKPRFKTQKSQQTEVTPATPKPKTKTQVRANEIRSERKATENKRKITYSKFKEKAQESKFKRMPRPLAPASLVKKQQPQSSTQSQAAPNPTPTATQQPSQTPPAAPRRPLRAPRIPSPPRSTSMRP